MLQTRVGKRTAAAAFVIAAQLVDEGQIDLSEALTRVSGAQLAQLMFPTFDEKVDKEQIAKGMNASPGAAVGKVVFDSHRAADEAAKGEKVILVRRETTPDDLGGMIAAQGILTSRGGKTSHAAVVARGMGKTCVCGAEELEVDLRGRKFTAPGGVVVNEGDVVSIDGTTGKVYLGEVPVQASPVVQYFEGTLARRLGRSWSPRCTGSSGTPTRCAGSASGPTADNPEDAERARRFGAEGIGLCRTEHMFLGDRRQLVEDLILAESDDERQAALDALLPLQREDFVGIFAAMDGLPVTVRLIDPPLHEFLPDLTELSVKVARGRGRGRGPGRDTDAARGGAAAARGQPDARPARRPARPGHPGPVRHAGRAIAEAAAERKQGRRRPASRRSWSRWSARCRSSRSSRRRPSVSSPPWPRSPASRSTR